MFWDDEEDYLLIELETTRYLGRPLVAEQFVDLLFRYGGIFIPERWDTQENTRRRLDRASVPEVIKEWIAPHEWQHLSFKRRKPVEIQISVNIRRSAHAKFNNLHVYIRDRYLRDPAQRQELMDFTTDLCAIISPVYGFIAHKTQERRQSPPLTPAERLPGVYWANFFGRPYIEMFGTEKLLAAPCHEVRQIKEDLILLLTADNPLQPEMIENDEVVNQVKAYLNQNAFAGPNFPDVRCTVPQFDFGDVRWGTEPPTAASQTERLNRIRSELEADGYEVISESSDRLTFRGDDGSVAVVDMRTGDITMDTTGEIKPPGSL